MPNKKPITLKQFREALNTIEDYIDQVSENKSLSATHIGCLVTLSDYGKEVERSQKKKDRRKVGKVVDWLDWGTTPTYDHGLVTVKWEGIVKPETRHISQVRPIE